MRYANVRHIKLSLDDLIGGMLEPHHFCKPIVKRPEDRDALAINAHPKLMFGGDLHIHNLIKSASAMRQEPLRLPLLADLFDRHGALHNYNLREWACAEDSRLKPQKVCGRTRDDSSR